VHGSRSTRATSGILAAIAGLASVGLLPWLDNPVFPDEGASLSSAHLGWTALWQHSHVVDLVLLPYYSFLQVWMQLSDSIEWARFLSLLAFGLTVFLVGHLGVRLGGRLCGVLAAIVAASDPLLVAAALSARPYALSALAATASVVALLRWLGGGGGRWLWWFCLASVVTLLLQMFAVLVPLSVLVAAVALWPQMFRGKWRAVIAPMGLALAAALSFAILGASQRSQLAWIPSPFERAQLIRAATGPAAGGYAPYAVFVLAIVIVTTALCLWAWSRGGFRSARLDLRLLAVLMAWTALPTAILVGGSLVRPVFVDRYVTASVPGLAIAIGLLTACAFDVMAVRLADRSRVIVESAVLGIAALVLFLAFSVPAAQLGPAITSRTVQAGFSGQQSAPRLSQRRQRDGRRQRARPTPGRSSGVGRHGFAQARLPQPDQDVVALDLDGVRADVVRLAPDQ
jgi:mannosyltransferase